MVKNPSVMKKHRYYPCVGTIPWRRKWHEQRSLVVYSPWSCRIGQDWATNTFDFKIISVFKFETQNCYWGDWKLVRQLMSSFNILRRIGILFCISQIPLNYFRCLVYNSFVFSILHLWKYISNLKLNKYCSCIIDKNMAGKLFSVLWSLLLLLLSYLHIWLGW